MNYRITGDLVQQLEVTLAPGEDFYVERGGVIYMEDGIEKQINLANTRMRHLLGATFSGESIILIRLVNNSDGLRKLVVGSRFGFVPVNLSGETMICHRGVYVASDNKIKVTTKISISGFIGGRGLLLQKISGNATVFLDTKGTPITISLSPGEAIELDEAHLIALCDIPDSQISYNWSLDNFIAGEGLSMLRVTGPGIVLLSPGALCGPDTKR